MVRFRRKLLAARGAAASLQSLAMKAEGQGAVHERGREEFRVEDAVVHDEYAAKPFPTPFPS
jgi:hypothetical protein